MMRRSARCLNWLITMIWRRAKSRPDFINKLSIVEEEADESIYWFELLEELGMSQDKELLRLKGEANQLVAIVVASKKTARAHAS